jgi:hypothetical protein
VQSQRNVRVRDRGYAILVAFFLAQTLLLVWFGVLRPERMVVKGVDPVYYYAYTRSIFFDGDLDFRNEFERLQEGGLPSIEETPTGKVANVFSIGPGILLAPFFLTGHVYALVTGYEPRDGYSAPYMMMSFVGLAVYGLFGILFSYAALRWLYPMKVAVLAVLGGWLATSVAYYIYPIALMPHTVSFFLVAVFLWIWLRVRDRHLSRRGWFLLGVLGGVMMLARWQNAIFLLTPVLDIWLRRRRREGEPALTPALSRRERESGAPLSEGGLGGISSSSGALTRARREDQQSDSPHPNPLPPGERGTALDRRVLTPPQTWLIFFAGAFIAFLPQIIAWQVIFGRPLLIPQGGGFLLWLRPQIHLLLFSRHNGLITWTPITLFGLIGLVQFARTAERRSLGIALIAVVVGQLYLNSIVVDWFAGMGFGMRRFVGTMPILMIGLATFLAWLTRKIRYYQTCVLVGFLVLWNALFLVQYYIPLFSWDRPITLREFFVDKIEIVQAVRRHSFQTAALVTAHEGNMRDAVRYAQEAVALGPHSPEARMTLALAYAQRGNRGPAGAELAAAAKILDGTEYVRKRFSSMLKRAGLGSEVVYYEEVLRELEKGNPPYPP